MLLVEVRDAAINTAKDFKERTTRKRPQDIPHLIDVYRGDAPVATLFIRTKVGGQFIVWLMTMAVAGFDADQECMVMESYSNGPNLTENRHPITGEEIAQGDFTTLAEKHDGIAKGWVTECLYVEARNRAGDFAIANLPYHYVGGKHLVWDEPHMPDMSDGQMTGAMADPIGKAMEKGMTFSQMVPGLATDELSRADLDVTVAKVIADRGNMMPSRGGVEVALWAEAEGERARALAEFGKRLR